MRIRNIIKTMIKTIYVQLPVTVLAYGIFPLVIIVLGTSGQSTSVNFNVPRILIEIVDTDQSELSKQFIQIFESEPFEIVHEDAAYRIIIPKGYGEAILNQESITIQIEEGREIRETMESMVRLAIQNHHQKLNEAILIEEKRLQADEELMDQLEIINETNGIERQYLSVDENLSSFERGFVMTSSLVFILTVSNLGAGAYVDDKLGFLARVHMMPLTKAQMLHYSLFESFMFAFLVLTVSFLTIAPFNLGIARNLLNLIPAMMVTALFAVSIVYLIAEFLPRALGKGLFGILMVIEMAIGNTGLGLELAPQIYRFWPGEVVQHLYEGVLTNQWTNFKHYGVIVMGITLLTYALVRLKIFVKWGRQ